jgi:molybdopterin biosynthesis enzyme
MAPDPNAPQRIVRLTALAEVLARIEARLRTVAPVDVDVSDALGRILASDVVIAAPVPKAALALRDGWAVTSDATRDAGPHAPAPLVSAVRIDVGQPLPDDSDAVAPFDAVEVRNGVAQALAPVGPGEGVLPASGDVAGGTTLLQAGERLDRVQIALLGMAGISEVRIRQPRIRVLRARAECDAVIDAAVELIAGAIEAEGGTATIEAPRDRLEPALAGGDADATIVVGGTGSGRNDAAVQALGSVGEVMAHGVALIPAETTAFGFVRDRAVLALPGRVDAALAGWHLLGRRMLALLAGARDATPMRPAKLTHKVTSTVGMAELVAVRCGGELATPIGSGYVSLSALVQAQGWIFVKPESEGYPAHTEVMVRPWP